MGEADTNLQQEVEISVLVVDLANSFTPASSTRPKIVRYKLQLANRVGKQTCSKFNN